MKLSTGKVAFPLEFDNGEVVQIYINPHDKGLQERIKNFEGSIHKRLEKIQLEKYKDAFSQDFDVSKMNFENLMNMSEEELEKISKQTDALNMLDKELEEEFCQEIDEVFQSDVSSKAFKYVPPLAMVKKDENSDECELYVILVLHALAIEIQKYGNKVNNTVNKYVSKYNKK